MCRSSSPIKRRKNDFVIKSITRSWLKRCSFLCLPCEGGKPLVPGWYFGQASSVSKPPVGVIIAAWNCRCWKVIRSHMVSLSPMTLMRISHPNIRNIKQHNCSRTGLSGLLWNDVFLVLMFSLSLEVYKLLQRKSKLLQIFLHNHVYVVCRIFLWKPLPTENNNTLAQSTCSQVCYYNQQTDTNRILFI